MIVRHDNINLGALSLSLFDVYLPVADRPTRDACACGRTPRCRNAVITGFTSPSDG